MATPNYAFEKRQREIAKKKKQDSKQSRKNPPRDEDRAKPATATPTTRDA